MDDSISKHNWRGQSEPCQDPDLLCWTGLTVNDVKVELPEISDDVIRRFVAANEENICDAMSVAAIDYVINNIGAFKDEC